MSCYLAIVPVIHLEDVWFHVLPHILNGKEHWQDFFTIQQIRKNLLLGSQQLWIMIEKNENENSSGNGKVLGIVLTQIDEFPEKKVLRIMYLGGKGFKRGMLKEMLKIETWARKRGASFVDILGRDEWKGLVAKMGYESPGRVYRKELKELAN